MVPSGTSLRAPPGDTQQGHPLVAENAVAEGTADAGDEAGLSMDVDEDSGVKQRSLPEGSAQTQGDGAEEDCAQGSGKKGSSVGSGSACAMQICPAEGRGAVGDGESVRMDMDEGAGVEQQSLPEGAAHKTRGDGAEDGGTQGSGASMTHAARTQT